MDFFLRHYALIFGPVRLLVYLEVPVVVNKGDASSMMLETEEDGNSL